MIRWVIDASALVDLMVVEKPRGTLREALRFDRCVTPAIMDLDAADLLSRLVTRGDVQEPEAAQVLRDIRAAPVQRFSHGSLLSRAWSLRGWAGAHAAAYLALADILGVPLLTSDSRLQDAWYASSR